MLYVSLGVHYIDFNYNPHVCVPVSNLYIFQISINKGQQDGCIYSLDQRRQCCYCPLHNVTVHHGHVSHILFPHIQVSHPRKNTRYRHKTSPGHQYLTRPNPSRQFSHRAVTFVISTQQAPQAFHAQRIFFFTPAAEPIVTL